MLEALRDRVLLDAGGDHEGADIVALAARGGGDEIGERDVRPAVAPRELLAQRVQGRDRLGARLVGEQLDVVAVDAAGQKPTTAFGANHLSAMIRVSIACASSNNARAAAPCFGSSRMAG